MLRGIQGICPNYHLSITCISLKHWSFLFIGELGIYLRQTISNQQLTLSLLQKKNDCSPTWAEVFIPLIGCTCVMSASARGCLDCPLATPGLVVVTDAISFLQALSKRIHYGKYVAEAKFLAAPDDYRAAIIAQVTILECFPARLNPFPPFCCRSHVISIDLKNLTFEFGSCRTGTGSWICWHIQPSKRQSRSE